MLVEGKKVLDLLKDVQRAPNCWCEMGIGNPMLNKHSAACSNIREFLELVEKVEKGEYLPCGHPRTCECICCKFGFLGSG